MTAQDSGRTASTEQEDAREPWDRFGWVMGAIWLVFLAFPIVAVANSDLRLWQKCVGVAVMLTFAVVYVHGLRDLGEHDSWAAMRRSGVTHLGIMIALTGATAVFVGAEALGLLPFIVSLGMFAFAVRTALLISGACIALAVTSSALIGELGSGLLFAGILLIVTVAVLIVRMVDLRSQEHRVLAEERALSSERERVARDVHDVLGHSLTVVTVKAELAERLVDLDPERAKAELADIRSLSRQALAEIRATVAGLRVARLTDEVDSARMALAGADIAVEFPDDPMLVDPRHRITMAWALREAVTNVVRHSRARRCQVTWGDSWLSVVDDGIGMRNGKEGNGIRGLRERVAAADGAVDITTGEDGRGTKVTVNL